MYQFTTFIYSFLFFAPLQLACHQPETLPPAFPAEPSWFAGYVFQPAPLNRNKVRVRVSLCDAPDPTDLQLDVYPFRPDTNADDDLGQVLQAGGRSVSPFYTQFIRTRYTDNDGTQRSDYDSQKRMAVDLDRDGISVLTVTSADSTRWAGWVITTNKTVDEVCLQPVVGRGGRRSGLGKTVHSFRVPQ